MTFNATCAILQFIKLPQLASHPATRRVFAFQHEAIMQTLQAHQAPGDDNAVHAAVTHQAQRQAAALAVQDAITRLDDALRIAGHTPGTWGIVLANGDCLINAPVIINAARGLLRRGAL